jgi:ubiquitin carboxyl-terminal hydrolase 16
MPNNNQTIAYAAGASLAAITLVYVFAPSYIFDGEDASSSRRRKGVVGLINPGNDCFVSSFPLATPPQIPLIIL